MKYVSIAAGFLALAGCMEPVSVPTASVGAVSFSQMMAETQGRPFECLDYDARTNTCEAISRYGAAVNGRVRIQSQSILPQAGGAVEVATTFREVNGQMCFDDPAFTIGLVSGTADLQAELAFAQIEEFIREQGPACLELTRAGDDYVATYTSGSDFFMASDPQRLTFFASPKRLREPEFDEG